MPDYSIRLDSIRFEKGLEKSISFASSKQNVPSLDALTRPLDLRAALKGEWRRTQEEWSAKGLAMPAGDKTQAIDWANLRFLHGIAHSDFYI